MSKPQNPTRPAADPHPMVRPWGELSAEERAVEARGMEVYAGMVEAMDYHYGRVVDFLEDIGEYENTVVIFLSDNGANAFYSDDYPGADTSEFRDQFDHTLENIGRPGSNYAYGIGFATGSSGPLDWFKLTVGEGGVRVPLLISGPGIMASHDTDAFAYVWDIVPTILDITGVDYPEEFQGRKVEPPRGRSMLGLLDGTKEALYGDDEFVGGEMGEGRWMRQGRLKAVLIPGPFGDGAWRLFDVVNDPGEANDLSDEMPEQLEALKAAWDQYAAEVGVVPGE